MTKQKTGKRQMETELPGQDETRKRRRKTEQDVGRAEDGCRNQQPLLLASCNSWATGIFKKIFNFYHLCFSHWGQMTPFNLMYSSINNNNNNNNATSSPAPPPRSHFHKTVTLQTWWLTKPESNEKTLGVAGLTFQQNKDGQYFPSTPIFKARDFLLETVDGVFVILQGYINKDLTLESGFSPDVFDHFVTGFPRNWEEFFTTCTKEGSSVECVSIAQDNGKDSIEGHADCYNDKAPHQHCDSYILGKEAQDNGYTISRNKATTVREPSSPETPREHIIKAVNDDFYDKSPVKQEFDVSSLKMSPIIRKDEDSSTESECLGMSSRRVTRSMDKKVTSKTSSSLVHDVSNFDKFDPEKLKGRKILRMYSRKASVTQIKSRRKLTPGRSQSENPKRKHISSYSTPRSIKGSNERCGSANILPLESFSEKRSRSGRVLLPTLEFWRNQRLVYDEDGQVCGVQEPM